MAILAAGLVGACSEDPTVYPESNNRNRAGSTSTYSQPETIFGPGGLNLFGGGEAPEGGAGSTGIGVNSFLWRASLDTISFMPLASADPFGGVIITDWYAPPETLAERFKVNLYILGPDGETTARLTEGDWKDSYAYWTADGKFIYFNSDRAGATNIYRMLMNGVECVREHD